MRAIGLLIVLASLAACDSDEDGAPTPAMQAEGETPDMEGADADTPDTGAPDADVTPDLAAPDLGVDMAADMSPPDMMDLDMAAADMGEIDMERADAEWPAGDSTVDAALPDADVPDAMAVVDAGVGVCVGPDPANPPAFPERNDECISCPGSPPAVWALEDFQPQSCGLGQTYGLNAFQGHVTLFATFNAGCGFCQAQAEGLERMRLELEFAGHEVWFVALNSASNLPHAERLIERCSYPLVQDTEEINAWGLQAGGVSDFYIYGADGRLVRHYDQTTEREERGRSLTLSVEEDYDELKQALIDAIE